MNTSSSPVPTTARLAPKKLALVGGIIAAMLCGMVVMGLIQRQQVAQQPPPPALPALYEVQGEADMLGELHLKKEWAGVDRTPPKPPPPPAPAPPPALPMFAPQGEVPRPPPPIQEVPRWQPPPAAPPIPAMGTDAPKTEPVKATTVPAHPPPVAKQQALPQKGPEDDWLFIDLKRTRTQGQGTAGGAGGEARGARSRASTLFPPAQWETPADPTKVIYASQIINCVLSQAIKTGQDGTIRCEVTETLYDKFGQLNPLVPQHSTIMGKVAGANVKPGQTTVPITVTKVELPDGTDLPLTGNMGSADGISAVPGSVDNRIPQVLLTAVLSAATAIGTRGLTGSTSGEYPTLGQEFTADVAQDLSRSGRRMVERALTLDPIITVPAQSPVTIQLSSNVSLQTKPRLVYR